MAAIIHYPSSIIHHNRGVALLVVLFVLMAITVISLGFLIRCDTELACGQNVLTRVQMDQLADSGLEHARGLILHPQDADSEYWHGDTGQQLVLGSADYYDVDVERDDSRLNDFCTYSIECEAYRLKNGQRIGRSALSGRLRLDPCVALWFGTDATLTSGWAVFGDVRCGGTLASHGTIDGDVFADALAGTGAKTGQLAALGELSLQWPNPTIGEFASHYTTQYLTSPLSNQTYGPYDPPRVFYRNGDLRLNGNVTINGMLAVSGDLTIHGDHVTIVAGKNLPALYVADDLIVDAVADLNVQGLAVVGDEIRLSAGAADVAVCGGLFTGDTVIETIGDSLGDDYAYVYGAPAWEPAGGAVSGALRFDGTDDYVEVRKESAFDMRTQITVAAWIKVAAFDRGFQAIVTKGDSAWRIQRWSNTNYIEFACTGLTHNPPHGSLYGDVRVNDGQWHHVAGVYDGAKVYLYVDGDLDASSNTSGFINRNDYRVMIGRNSQMSDRLWNGWIDDVQIYDRGLSEGEVESVRLGNSLSGLVARWRLDERGVDVTVAADPAKSAIVTWPGGARTRWSPAAGAFFSSLGRN